MDNLWRIYGSWWVSLFLSLSLYTCISFCMLSYCLQCKHATSTSTQHWWELLARVVWEYAPDWQLASVFCGFSRLEQTQWRLFRVLILRHHTLKCSSKYSGSEERCCATRGVGPATPVQSSAKSWPESQDPGSHGNWGNISRDPGKTWPLHCCKQHARWGIWALSH